jgi:hypothetical protein
MSWLYIRDLRLDILNLRSLLDIRDLLLRWLNNRLCNCRIGNNLGSLNRLIINVLFDSLLRNIVDFYFLSNVRDIFSDVFNLLIISVLFFDWDVVGLSHSLILSYGSCNWYIFCSLLGNLFDILSFIRHLNICNLRFIISVSSLHWNVFNVWLSLWLRLLVNGGRLLHNLLWLQIWRLYILLRLNNRLH